MRNARSTERRLNGEGGMFELQGMIKSLEKSVVCESVCDFVVDEREKRRRVRRDQVRRALIYICVSNFWPRGGNEMDEGAEGGGVRKLEGLYDKTECRGWCPAWRPIQLIE